MNLKLTKFVAWLVLLAGLAGFYWLGHYMSGQAREEARAFAVQHAQAGKQGWLRLVYDNPFLTGKPQAHIKSTPNYYTDWTPKKKQRPHTFSWRWLAKINVPVAGEYVFDVLAPEGVRLVIDGKVVIDRWVGNAPRHELAGVQLAAGDHLIDLQNVQRPWRLNLTLTWIPPGVAERELITLASLQPLSSSAAPGQLTALHRNLQRWTFLTWILPGLWWLLWLLVLRAPVRAWQTVLTHRWFLAILGLAGAARMLWAGSLHGICGESAHFAIRAGMILEGALPFNGMNTRVGPIWDYMLTLPYAVFGPSWEMLRLSGALMHLLALVFCYRVALREAGKATALACALALALLPSLVMYGREPVETTSLGLFFLFLSLDLISLSRVRPWLSIAAGIIWGLAVFNHPIFVMVPFTLVISGVVISRLRVIAWPQLWGLGVGLVIGLLPRIYDRVAHAPKDVMSFTNPDRLSHFWDFQWVFGRALDGEVIYRGYVGQLLWDTWWVIPVVLAAGLLLLIGGMIWKRDKTWWIEAWLALALAIHLAMVPLGAPTAQPRYFLYCLVYAALLLGRSFARAFDWSGGRIRQAVLAGGLTLAVFCAASLGVNYFYSFLSTGGRPHEWKSPLLDFTSDAWMNHGELAQELIKRGYPVVATGDFWHHTLHLSMNLWQGEPLKFQGVPLRNASGTERAAVFYNSPEGKERMRRFLNAHQHHTYRRLPLPKHLDNKYILLEKTGPQVGYPSDLD
jgi:hypothetical protein